jgi:RNA polymerase sigma-70 factor, ECF subfamily
MYLSKKTVAEWTKLRRSRFFQQRGASRVVTDMSMKKELNLRLIERETQQRFDDVSDDGLMLLAAAGDSGAFAKVVSHNERSVRRFCFGMLGNRAQADEVAQDTFMKLWENREKYQPCNKFRGFLFSIAKNRCISIIRRRAVVSFIGLSSMKQEPVSALYVEDHDGKHDGYDTDERDAIIRAAVRRLPVKLRVAVILRFVDEMSYDEIALIIGRSASAVRSRVHYGLKALAGSLPEEVRTWND